MSKPVSVPAGERFAQALAPLGPEPAGAYGMALAYCQTFFASPLGSGGPPARRPSLFRPEPTAPATRPRLPQSGLVSEVRRSGFRLPHTSAQPPIVCAGSQLPTPLPSCWIHGVMQVTLELPDTMERLRQTNARLDPELIHAALERDKARKQARAGGSG